MKKFINEKADLNNPNWNNLIKREAQIYQKEFDLRSDFERDTNRILYSKAYKRMKHKTQVFFSPTDDHICTRIEHVNHVESISYSIANTLDLNTELTKAIAIGHDLGHAPFGHEGEKILSEISQRDLGTYFWHEQNGLNMVDNIELLENPDSNFENMNLTYAVRDGIISHCGEVDENALKPRTEFINLDEYNSPNKYAPYTWEACVVKISDKISYIFRDIEDAISLHLLDEHLTELYDLLKYDKTKKINNSNIINTLIYDICNNSSPEKGICLSDEKLTLLNNMKKFNYKHIYHSIQIKYSKEYFAIIINRIYDVLNECYNGAETGNILEQQKIFYPNLITNFQEWIEKYWNLTNRSDSRLKNKIIFDMNNKIDYQKAIIYYISGMTDNFAISCYNEIIKF
ncbi:MAG: HD domain-containing protein [Clostridia bacterium]|nr:HD domain-containing protein [Clostridia bacterium]